MVNKLVILALSWLNVLDRYLFAEVFGLFAFGMLGFVVIGMVDIVFTLIDMFINNGVPLLVVLKLLVYKIPAIMVLFFPMAVLFAVMIVLIRLSKDSEITVLRAGGISLGRIVAPILAAGFIIFLLSFITNEKIVPFANRISDRLIEKAVIKKPAPEIVENTFFQDGEARTFFIKKIYKSKNEMENVLIYEITPDYPRVISAKYGSWDGRCWELKNGNIHKFDENGLINYQGQFETMTIYTDQDLRHYYQDQDSPRQMDSRQLKTKIKELGRKGIETAVLKVEYYMKYSLPLASFIFALTGVAFALLFIKNSKDLWGVIVAVLMALLSVGFYFFVMATFRSLGRGGMISPWLGAWGPDLIYGTLALAIISYQSLKR